MLKIVIAIFFLSIPLTAAQDSAGGVALPPHTVKILGEPSQQMTDAAIEYIRQKTGSDYYNKHITYRSGQSQEICYGDVCEVTHGLQFNQIIPWESGSDHRGGPMAGIFSVSLDENGKVTYYTGPPNAYQFLLSKEQALEKAQQYGLREITKAAVVNAWISPGYQLAWEIISNDQTNCMQRGVSEQCLAKGIYLDVDTGDLKEEFTVSSLVESDVQPFPRIEIIGDPAVLTMVVGGLILFLFAVIFMRTFK